MSGWMDPCLVEDMADLEDTMTMWGVEEEEAGQWSWSTV